MLRVGREKYMSYIVGDIKVDDVDILARVKWLFISFKNFLRLSSRMDLLSIECF